MGGRLIICRTREISLLSRHDGKGQNVQESHMMHDVFMDLGLAATNKGGKLKGF